jgi:hypothetical protein
MVKNVFAVVKLKIEKIAPGLSRAITNASVSNAQFFITTALQRCNAFNHHLLYYYMIELHYSHILLILIFQFKKPFN